jgi:hypothetical protein
VLELDVEFFGDTRILAIGLLMNNKAWYTLGQKLTFSAIPQIVPEILLKPHMGDLHKNL